MNTLEIPDRNIAIMIPAKYDEMNAAQVAYIMKQLAKHRAGAISLDAFRVGVLYKLCGIRRTWRSAMLRAINPNERILQAEQVVLLCDQLLGGILEKANDGYQIKFDSVQNFLPHIRIGWRKFVGPSEALLDLSFEEFRSASDEMHLYTKTKKEHHLDRMIACLYRPAGSLQPSGRRIEPYSSDTIEKYATSCHRLKAWKKQLILLWFSSCVKYMQTDRFIIGSQEVNFSELFKTDTEGTSAGKSLGWITILFDLAEKQIFGDAEKTDKQNMIEILSLLLHYKQRNDATSKKIR